MFHPEKFRGSNSRSIGHSGETRIGDSPTHYYTWPVEINCGFMPLRTMVADTHPIHYAVAPSDHVAFSLYCAHKPNMQQPYQLGTKNGNGNIKLTERFYFRLFISDYGISFSKHICLPPAHPKVAHRWRVTTLAIVHYVARSTIWRSSEK